MWESKEQKESFFKQMYGGKTSDIKLTDEQIEIIMGLKENILDCDYNKEQKSNKLLLII